MCLDFSPDGGKGEQLEGPKTTRAKPALLPPCSRVFVSWMFYSSSFSSSSSSFFLFLMRNVINGRTFNLLGSVASEKLLEVIDGVRRLPSALRNFNFIDGSRKKKNDEE